MTAARRAALAACAFLVAVSAACGGKTDASAPDAELPGAAQADVAGAIDFGEVAAGAPLAFTVPAGTLGFQIVVEGPEGSCPGVASLRGPGGVVHVADFAPRGKKRKLALGSDGIGALGVPRATLRGAVAPGRWDLAIGGFASCAKLRREPMPSPKLTRLERARVRVRLQRTSDGRFHGGALDLHVYVPEGLAMQDPGEARALAPASLADEPALRLRVDLFFAELERLFGIGRGAVAFHRIEPTYLRTTSSEARVALLRRANAGTTPALHVVLTESLEDEDDEREPSDTEPRDGILGYAGGIPGAVAAPGSARGAIAVTFRGNRARQDALTMLHELGHFAGLEHVDDEPNPEDDDPGAEDGTNLMKDEACEGDVFVTSEQVRVVRGSPLYRAFPR